MNAADIRFTKWYLAYVWITGVNRNAQVTSRGEHEYTAPDYIENSSMKLLTGLRSSGDQISLPFIRNDRSKTINMYPVRGV